MHFTNATAVNLFHFLHEQEQKAVLHNIAAVQIGRGKQPNGEDFGRRGVTQQDKDRYGFRTPSLLNVTATAPYTHAGAFTDLDAIIAHHLAPDESVSQFDFSFANNPQLKHVAGLLSDSKQWDRGPSRGAEGRIFLCISGRNRQF